MKQEYNIIAIVVTYNRLELLKECLESLLKQGNILDKIIIVNNASIDNTKEYLESIKNEQIIVHHLEKNIGGAGGNNFGIKEANKYNPTHVWLMDDDTIVKENSLQNLLNADIELNGNYSYLASAVYWVDGTDCIMNKQKIQQKVPNFLECSKKGLIPILSTSFVSMFINFNSIKNLGLPIQEFFIWNDDVEYSSRLVTFNNAYLCLNSEVIHKTKTNIGVDIVLIDDNRSHFLFFEGRNIIYMIFYSKIPLITKFGKFFVIARHIFKALINFKFKNLSILLKGLFYGLFFKPKIEYLKDI